MAAQTKNYAFQDVSSAELERFDCEEGVCKLWLMAQIEPRNPFIFK